MHHLYPSSTNRKNPLSPNASVLLLLFDDIDFQKIIKRL